MRVSDAVKSLKRARRVGSQEWRAHWRERPVERDTVFYESFAGNGMLCNPEAIFRELLDHPEFGHLTHVWCLSPQMWSAGIREEFDNHPRVRFVRYKSPQYFRVLFTAGYLFNNATFPPEFTKRDEQVYVNTWHGTPLKMMGYDEPGGGPGARNVIRNFLSADYLLAANDFMAEQMYEDAYRLTNIYPGRLVIEGSPRVDRQFLDDDERRGVLRRLRSEGVDVQDGQKVILYAPTWKGESFQKPSNDVLLLANRVRELKQSLPSDHQVLLRVHQQVYTFALEHPELRDILVPNEIPSNEVLGITDTLVTDYSSIFFDFLATGRPMVFFTPDMRDYEGYRGLYLDPTELPGPVVTTVPRLSQVLAASGSGSEDDPEITHRTVYDAARQRFASREDGSASSRVIDVVLRGRADRHAVRPANSDGRIRLLIHLGGMQPNGITTSAVNLLKSIDHSRYDVSVLYPHSTSASVRASVAKIDSRVRVLPRIGAMLWSLSSERERATALRGGDAAQGQTLARANRMFEHEWRRCFGLAEFDHIVDFSGYAAFWARLLLQGPAVSHSIWLHNDLKADQMREVDGRRPHEANLGSVFSTYDQFDHLVSVSEALMEINRANLDGVAPAERFTFARNTIDADYITSMAFGEFDCGPRDGGVEPRSVPTDDLPSAVRDLAEVHGLSALESAVARYRIIEQVIPPQPRVRTFVTVGRLSPEKNHARLIEAFALVHQENPDTRLVIVGGGPLQHALTELTFDLGVSEAVTIAGQQSNPHVVLARSDVFVLSSDYEGQPMVILEARVLGLPVVSTRFSSVAGAVPEGTGLVVERDVESLADGMRAALREEVPNPLFDPIAYNREATEDFYRVLSDGDVPTAAGS